MRTPTQTTKIDQNRTAKDYDIGHAELLSAADERALAEQISKLRRAHWEALLSYAPAADGVADVLAGAVAAELATDLAAYRVTSRALRERSMNSTKDAFLASVGKLAAALACTDFDKSTAGALHRDYEALARRDLRGVRIVAKLPPRGSGAFQAHLDRIRGAEAALKAARNAFAAANLRLVMKMARRYANPHLTFGDLVQEGNFGLMTAIDRFDHARGLRFSTYACWWIRHAIQRAIANYGRTVRVPCHMSDTQAKLRRAKWQLHARLGRAPTNEELAAAANITTDKIAQMDRALLEPLRSLDAPIGTSDGVTLLDTLADEGFDVVGSLESEELRLRLLAALTELRPIESDVLRRRYGLAGDDEVTLREVGERYSLSRERIRQIQETALEKLRAHLAA